jgi:hypothetical protein
VHGSVVGTSSEVRHPRAYVGYRGKTGKHLLVLSFTGFGPTTDLVTTGKSRNHFKVMLE